MTEITVPLSQALTGVVDCGDVFRIQQDGLEILRDTFGADGFGQH